MTRLVIATGPVAAETLSVADARATALVLGPAALAAATAGVVDIIAGHRSYLLAVGCGVLRGHALAAGLFADFFGVDPDARIEIESHGDVAAGLAWRIGRGAFRLLVESRAFSGSEAVETGLADVLVPAGSDSLEWARRWFGSRNLLALQSGARLMRLRGGDTAERFEFARLFAAGEPQEGLGLFLDKMPLDFSTGWIVESI